MSVNIKIKNAEKRYGKTTIISNLSWKSRKVNFHAPWPLRMRKNDIAANDPASTRSKAEIFSSMTKEST